MIAMTGKESAKLRKDRQQRDADHTKAARCLVPNEAARAVRLIIMPVYSMDESYARTKLEEFGIGALRVSPYIEAHERTGMIEILQKYQVPYQEPEEEGGGP